MTVVTVRSVSRSWKVVFFWSCTDHSRSTFWRDFLFQISEITPFPSLLFVTTGVIQVARSLFYDTWWWRRTVGWVEVECDGDGKDVGWEGRVMEVEWMGGRRKEWGKGRRGERVTRCTKCKYRIVWRILWFSLACPSITLLSVFFILRCVRDSWTIRFLMTDTSTRKSFLELQTRSALLSSGTSSSSCWRRRPWRLWQRSLSWLTYWTQISMSLNDQILIRTTILLICVVDDSVGTMILPWERMQFLPLQRLLSRHEHRPDDQGNRREVWVCRLVECNIDDDNVVSMIRPSYCVQSLWTSWMSYRWWHVISMLHLLSQIERRIDDVVSMIRLSCQMLFLQSSYSYHHRGSSTNYDNVVSIFRTRENEDHGAFTHIWSNCSDWLEFVRSWCSRQLSKMTHWRCSTIRSLCTCLRYGCMKIDVRIRLNSTW